jgi:hypothetical protein
MAALCCAVCISPMLAACSTNPATLTSATSLKAQCAPWRAISYSKNDTVVTVRQVRVHNVTGRNLGCWS